MKASDIFAITDLLIPQFEGYRSHSYWDVTRWSIGYGTEASGPNVTISQVDALAAMRSIVADNYEKLQPYITRPLTANQWAALMSFAYNLGVGAAMKLVSDVNSGDDGALEVHWKKYIYAGGVVNDTLVDRRDREWEVWAA